MPPLQMFYSPSQKRQNGVAIARLSKWAENLAIFDARRRSFIFACSACSPVPSRCRKFSDGLRREFRSCTDDQHVNAGALRSDCSVEPTSSAIVRGSFINRRTPSARMIKRARASGQV
jgi:hypothetical protein